MRECPQWFQDELTRIGGVNQYDEPIFKLVWSTEPKTTIGGRWNRDGFVGYRSVPLITGQACWALIVWEPASMQGCFETWEMDNRDDETSLLQTGGFSSYGKYRLLKRFLHQEIESKPVYRQKWRNGVLETERSGELKLTTYRMEPCGLILDLMIPSLLSWRKLTDARKVEILLEEEQAAKDEFTKRAKDAIDGTRLGRTSKASLMVQKRAELIERGFAATMAVAAQSGLGMRIGD